MSRKRTGWNRLESLVRGRGDYRQLSIHAWVQIIGIMVVAVATLIVTWQFSKAGGLWQDAIREEIKWSEALQEDLRYVYQDEAALGFQVAAAEARADGLRELKDTSRLAASEHDVATRTVSRLRQSATADDLIRDVSYARGELGYDVIRRLVDIRARGPAVLRELNPDVTQARAYRHEAYAIIAAGIGIFSAVIVALTACIRARIPRRRPSNSMLADGLADDLIPQPRLVARGLRHATMLQLVVWVLLAILPLVQLLVAGQEQRAQADAARRTVQLTTSITANILRGTLTTDGVNAVNMTELGATARELAALDLRDPADAAEERAVAAAEHRIAYRLLPIVETMGRAPTDTDGVDHAAVTALAATSKY